MYVCTLDFEEMASCPSNLYCVGGEEATGEGLLERSQTTKSVLYTTYKNEAKATVIKTDGKSCSTLGKKAVFYSNVPA